MRSRLSRLCIVVLVILIGGITLTHGEGRRVMLPGPTDGPGGSALTLKEMLGESLFMDAFLSSPDGQSCASCHLASAGFADPDWQVAVSEGAAVGLFGSRNTPGIAYCGQTPAFHYDEERDVYVGGLFRDGRATDLVSQAARPFLNPLEMNNPTLRAVVQEVRTAPYAGLFDQVYGVSDWDDSEQMFNRIVDAVVAYERSAAMNRYDSKYDYYLRGEGDELSALEQLGLALFEGKGQCAVCHPSSPGPYDRPPLFTDYTYHDLGVPPNPDNPFYGMPMRLNYAGDRFVDLGLGAVIGDPAELGKFKVPSLRNVALTAPYMHNGLLATLGEAIEFLTVGAGADHLQAALRLESRSGRGAMQRSESGRRYPVPDPPTAGGGSPGLTEEEIDALTAFLLTLTDGYQP